jgi:hypothetical protein
MELTTNIEQYCAHVPGFLQPVANEVKKIIKNQLENKY